MQLNNGTDSLGATHWPALNQRRNYSPGRNDRQTTWIQNGSNWEVNKVTRGDRSQVLLTNSTTTPWPVLNRRINEFSPGNNSQQSVWIQNGSNWVRNPQSNVQMPSVQNRPQNIPAPNPRNPWQNNRNNMPVISVTSPRTPNNHNNIITSNNRPSGFAVGFISSPKTPTHTNNNLNINFLDNERTKIPVNSLNTSNINNGKNGSFSLGSFVESENNSYQGSQDPIKGDVDDDELREFSEVLLSKDTNNAAQYVTINLQKMTTSRSRVDEAPLP